jgi:hypothetical protein
MAKVKAGNIEKLNHYVNNPIGTTVTPEMVLQQVKKYNQTDDHRLARNHKFPF